MIYSTYQRNHVILPGREQALYNFLDTTLVRDGKTEKHKWRNAYSSNSEDAITWSCFDVLRCQPKDKIAAALDEIFEDAFGDFTNTPIPQQFSFADEHNIEIHIGKNYFAKSVVEDTEVDASIETDSKLIFFEAKLYSKISLPTHGNMPHDQIIRKLRVGLDVANQQKKEFYFIFLDIAPVEYLLKFGEKAISAEYFTKYKDKNTSLEENLTDIPYPDIEKVKANMGWLTWASLFKTVLRVVILT
jgi:hypothetical protein